MKVLLAGVDNTVEFYRDDPDLTMELAIIDPADGSELATPSVTNDDTDATLGATPIEQGDTSFGGLVSLTKGVKYLIQHDPVDLGPEQVVTILSTDATSRIHYTKYPFMYDMSALCNIKGIRSSATYSPAATYAGKPLWLQWTDSNGVVNREYCLVLKYELRCPIDSDDVRDRFPRVNVSAIPTWQEVAQVGWQPQVDDAWDELRNEFYANGLILDRVVSADMLKEVMYALVEKRLLNMGAKPTGSGENLRDSQNRIGQKVSQLMTKAFNLPLQIDENDDNTNDGRSYKRSILTNIWSNN